MKAKSLPTNFDNTKLYSVADAATLLPQLSTSKFVGSVDIDMVLTIPKKQQKETVKGSVVFPHQFGEQKKVIVFCDEKDVKAAKAAGAVEAGLDNLIKLVEEGHVEFDVVVATPDVMAKIAKLGKVLGPKGLMPNPANGTVSADPVSAVASFIGGKQNYKMSEQGVIRARVAKLDMDPAHVAENIKAFVKSTLADTRKFGNQPIARITLSPTMGAGVKLDVNQVLAEI